MADNRVAQNGRTVLSRFGAIVFFVAILFAIMFALYGLWRLLLF